MSSILLLYYKKRTTNRLLSGDGGGRFGWEIIAMKEMVPDNHLAI